MVSFRVLIVLIENKSFPYKDLQAQKAQKVVY